MGIVNGGGGGGTFNGGTITGGLTIHPATDATLLALAANAAQNADMVTVANVNGSQIFRLDAYDDFTFTLTDQGGDFRVLGAGSNNLVITSSQAVLSTTGGDPVQIRATSFGSAVADSNGVRLRDGTDTTHVQVNGTGVGLFGATPAAQPTLTSGTATPEQIALALQSYGAAGGT